MSIPFASTRCRILGGTVLLAVLLASGDALAALYSWNDISGGSFNDPMNWNPNGLPGVVDNVFFDLDNDYEIEFGQNEASYRAYVETDNIQLQLGGHQWSVANECFIGWTGTQQGAVTVRHGIFSANDVFVGYQDNAIGSLTVSNEGHVAIGSTLAVGYVGEAVGNVLVEDGGQMDVGSLFLGEFGETTGALRVTGVGSRFFCSSLLTVGLYGQGILYVDEGGTVTSTNGSIGFGHDSTAAVNGLGSSWTITNELALGDVEGATGTLDVLNGGSVICYGSYVGRNSGGHGIVRLGGGGARWDHDNRLVVGFDGQGEVLVNSDSTVTCEDAYLGFSTGSSGKVTVSGDDALLECRGSLFVGGNASSARGSSLLLVEDNGQVDVAGTLRLHTDSAMVLDGGTIRTDHLTLEPDSTFEFRDGTLTITGGVTNNLSPDVLLDGSSASRLPTVRLVTGATMNVAGFLVLGQRNRGAMEVHGGSVLQAVDTVLGDEFDSTGAMTVSDLGSSWVVYSSLIVGSEGNGVLCVKDGAVVSSQDGILGGQIGGKGDATVAGSGARWETDQLFVGGHVSGAAGNGRLTIGPGGTVQVTGFLNLFSTGQVDLAGGTLDIGRWTNAGGTLNFSSGTLRFTGSPLVIGTGGLLGDQVQLDPGMHLEGTVGAQIDPGAQLEIASGASISSTQIDNLGQMTLLGSSALVTSDLLFNEGLLTGEGRLETTLLNASAGEVRGQAGRRLLCTGVYNANQGEIHLDEGTIEFTEGLTNQYGGFLAGRGTLKVHGGLNNLGVIALSGGFTDVYGDVNNDAGTSQIIVTGGSVTTFFDDVHSDGLIRISTGSSAVFLGELAGTGGATGPGTAYIEGDLRPGNSPAEISFGGDVVFSSGSVVEIELGGRLAGDEYDVVHVAGQAVLDGQLSVSLVDGFEPAGGDAFTVLTYASRSGVFDSYEGLMDGPIPLIPTYGATSLVLTVATPGDANLDGRVDADDARILADRWLRSSGMIWTDGDFNGDHRVDDLDASIMAAHWLAGTEGSQSVPEPSGLVLLTGLLAAAWFGLFRSNHSNRTLSR
ncbi:MAG: hypothetical protein JW818_18895 [Pirellulales bacterium]|nr:hypothetical protein [Pirellulales bacterium]